MIDAESPKRKDSSAGSRTCPRCGTKLSVFSVFNSDPLDCPNCLLALSDDPKHKRRYAIAQIVLFVVVASITVVSHLTGIPPIGKAFYGVWFTLWGVLLVLQSWFSPLIQNPIVRSPKWPNELKVPRSN